VLQLSPLYHGIALVRGFNLGQLEWAMLGHVGFLTAMAAVGMAVASRRVSALLLT
jgi:lipooligosaccharide transport system permease protein